MPLGTENYFRELARNLRRLSAITLVNLALLKHGDEVLLPDNVYGPSREHARSLLGDLGDRKSNV